jgi:murein DD-endopeptidase MepM/ murein hydrolase activator NlpD
LVEDLAKTRAENSTLQEEVTTLDQTKKELLQDTVRKLDEKNKILDSVLNAAGVKVKTRENGKNSGGPYTRLSSYQAISAQAQPLTADEVLARVDRYIETIQAIPLGAPVSGGVSSAFGRRFDPLNENPAFHEGVDIRGGIGTKVKATADGRVRDRGYHGAYGWFVELDHGNGFVTMVCHLKKILVKDGEKVTRGQAVGLLGNSGRTTGAHVHYEIRHKGRPVNPRSFMAVSAKALTPA